MDKYNNNIIRSLYLASLFNSDRCVQQVRFIEDVIEIKYANSSLKQFSFSTLDINRNEISKKLDNMLEVNKNPSKGDEVLKIKYNELFVFSHNSKYFFFILTQAKLSSC